MLIIVYYYHTNYNKLANTTIVALLYSELTGQYIYAHVFLQGRHIGQMLPGLPAV